MTDEPTKTCRGCASVKPISSFHKHKQMADGHLNFCKVCFYQKSKANRAAKPDSRKAERARLRDRVGGMTWQEYQEKRRREAKGKKVIASAYAQRRRARIDSAKMSELDVFVVEEAYRLRQSRKLTTQIDWHVDHIVPLNHRKACGLHNAYNLQVVPATWNLAKRHANMDKYSGV